jgi:hypothetical protein
MTAFALPRRRQSKAAKVAKSAAKAWTAMKIGSIAGRTARKTAKAYGSWKVVKFLGRRGPKLMLIPVAAGGGFAVWKGLRSSSTDQPTYGSPQGPATTSQTVSPPKDAHAAAMNGEAAMSDAPAGTVNPPATPPPGATS